MLEHPSVVGITWINDHKGFTLMSLATEIHKIKASAAVIP